MKKLFKLSLAYGGVMSTISLYNNYIKPAPADPQLHQKKNKRVVVVGAGIVGLGTAYYLSQYPENEVILIEKGEKCAQECSVQNGCLLMRYNAVPWTFRPLMDVVKGVWRSDTSQAIYLTKALQEPGMFKFFWYWMQQRNKSKVTADIMKLNDLQELLMDQLLISTGITPQSINYENDAVSYAFDVLKGIDVKKAYEEYQKIMPVLPHGAKQEIVFGKEELQERVFKHFPKYTGLLKYHLAIVNPNYTLNTQLFCQKLDEYLRTKSQSNVQVFYKTELENFVFHDEQKHLIKGIKLRGKNEILECDAVVLCAGSFIARLLKTNFNLVCPVIPVKGYTMDIPSDAPMNKIHFGFKDIAFVATHIDPGYWRIAAFGDLSGQDKSFDPRRVRFLKNIVSERLDKTELYQYKNLNTCLRPVPPDDLPIIGNLRFFPNVYINAGHSGRGTTFGLATCKLVTEQLMEEKVTCVEDPKPYSPRRFQL
eukprot:403353731